MTGNNGVTEESEQVLQFLKDIVINNGLTDEELEQGIEELEQCLPSTVKPEIIGYLKMEYNSKQSKETRPSREKYGRKLYALILTANQEKHQIPSESLKDDLREKGLKESCIDNTLEELSGICLKFSKGKYKICSIDPAYIKPA